MTLNPQPRRVMQGGEISGRDQVEISKAARRLIRLIRRQMDKYGAPPEMADQEIASVLMQVFIEETEPTAFLEGALTQLGWQLVVRAGGLSEEHLLAAQHWFSNGVNAGLLEPMAMPVGGRA